MAHRAEPRFGPLARCGALVRPGKLRFEVETQTSPASSTPPMPPKHAPHEAVLKLAPASVSVSMMPSRSAAR